MSQAHSPRGAPQGHIDFAFALLADGKSEAQTTELLVAQGVSLVAARSMTQQAIALLSSDRDSRVRRDLRLALLYFGLGAGISIGLSALARGSGSIIVATGGLLVAFAYGVRGVSRQFGWRTRGDIARGRALTARYATATELQERASAERAAARRSDAQMYIVVVLVILFFAAIAIVGT
jgi:hypothetical protein